MIRRDDDASSDQREVARGLRIRPRDAWGSLLPPVGRLEPEAESDVRLLVLHHSASSNGYARGDVLAILQSFFRLHTAEGWPDVAYNFFVDRFGGVWEGRAESLERPIKGDMTAGAPGFALSCCFIGDHQAAPPTEEAVGSMTRLLGWLCRRYAIDPGPGAIASFVSRGSNLWPPGAPVTVRTISGHRDVSRTLCPGDHLYRLLERTIPERVAALTPSAARGPSSRSAGAEDAGE